MEEKNHACALIRKTKENGCLKVGCRIDVSIVSNVFGVVNNEAKEKEKKEKKMNKIRKVTWTL